MIHDVRGYGQVQELAVRPRCWLDGERIAAAVNGPSGNAVGSRLLLTSDLTALSGRGLWALWKRGLGVFHPAVDAILASTTRRVHRPPVGVAGGQPMRPPRDVPGQRAAGEQS
jgi:hypothetical protein